MVSPDSVLATKTHQEQSPKDEEEQEQDHAYEIEQEQTSETSSTIGLPLESPQKTRNTVSPPTFVPVEEMINHSAIMSHEDSEEEEEELGPGQDWSKMQLEERVHQLETKLAVLSRLLQSVHLQPKLESMSPLHPPSSTPPPVPTPDRTDSPDLLDESRRRRRQRIRSESLGSTPHLESPAPPSRQVCKTYLEEKALGDLTETEESPNATDPLEQHHTLNTRALEDLVQPPSRRQRMRGISMDETVAHDNRSEDKSIGSLQQQPLLFGQSTPESVVYTREENNEPSWSPKQSGTPVRTPQTTLSPPGSEKRRRNLSFRLLYSGDEEAYSRRNETAPNTTSLTLAERLWLGPSILQFQKQEQEKQDAAEQHADRLSIPSSSSSSPPPFSFKVPDENVRSKWLDHLNSFQESTPDVDVQMEEFIKVPSRVENLMAFGFCICTDSFLYMITVLPIRFVWSCFLLILNYVVLWRANMRERYLRPQFQFHRQHLYQIIQVTILYTIFRYVLLEISIGKLYHWIRGQAMLKLYVLVAMAEIFDRLFGSLGQDCLESMYWNTVSRPKSSRMLISVLVVLIYASLHSILLFVHVVTLHVAMNSTDQVLLTLLISGNFAEIKSTVFKKYNKAALFKISSSDICERFKLALFLSLVLILNVCQGLEDGQLWGYLRIWGIVSGSEMMADWIKHAFITKFNFLPARVYSEYALLLAGDIAGIGHEGVNLDHSHAVVKRIGFAQIPLVCVLFRLVREAARYYAAVDSNTKFSWISMLSAWLVLVMIKLALGVLLHRLALSKLVAAPEFSQQKSPLLKKSKKKKNQ